MKVVRKIFYFVNRKYTLSPWARDRCFNTKLDWNANFSFKRNWRWKDSKTTTVHLLNYPQVFVSTFRYHRTSIHSFEKEKWKLRWHNFASWRVSVFRQSACSVSEYLCNINNAKRTLEWKTCFVRNFQNLWVMEHGWVFRCDSFVRWKEENTRHKDSSTLLEKMENRTTWERYMDCLVRSSSCVTSCSKKREWLLKKRDEMLRLLISLSTPFLDEWYIVGAQTSRTDGSIRAWCAVFCGFWHVRKAWHVSTDAHWKAVLYLVSDTEDTIIKLSPFFAW